MLSYARLTPPAGRVVGLARALAHLKLEPDTEEAEAVTAALAAAEEHLDGWSGALRHALLAQTWEATAPAPGPCGCGDAPGFLLDLPPVAAVLSVEALTGGAYLPVSTWRSLSPNRRGSLALLPAPGTRWPTTDPDPAAWRIRFRAGYATPAEVPPPIQAAILLIAADLFDNRGGKQLATLTDNPTIARLLARYQPSEA